MKKLEKEIKRLCGFVPSKEALEKLKIWHEMFLEYNSHTNLMSKNDIQIVLEKHVLDSLAITVFKNFTDSRLILDVGCGGGFPSLILSIFFPDKEIIGVDSTSKKINFLNLVKNELNLKNFSAIAQRVENIPSLNADIITNRAVGKISDIWAVSKKHLKKGGYFVSYKAKTAEEEAKAAIQKFRELKLPQFISYNLPVDEALIRKLVIFKV